MYFSVVMSSVRGARKATFLVVGNIGLDCAKVLLWFPILGIGLFVKIDVTLYPSLYGTASARELIVVTVSAEFVDEEPVSD